MCSMNVEGLTETPSRNVPGLIPGGWRRMKQTRIMGKQTRKKMENMLRGKGSGGECKYRILLLYTQTQCNVICQGYLRKRE